MWSRGYHRISDDSVSSFSGHPSLSVAVKDALDCLKSDDIDRAWVRDPTGHVIWRRNKKQLDNG